MRSRGRKSPVKPKIGWIVLFLVWSLSASAQTLPTSGRVVRVFDGDTVMLDSGRKVRYLGVDTPEVDHEGDRSECFAVAAWRENRRWVEGKVVRLEYDEVTIDPHGRLLAYVFVEGGRMVNLELIRGGYAFVHRVPKGFRRFPEFLEAQREALKERRGMWGRCRVRPAPAYMGNRRSFVFHRISCPFARKTARKNRVRFETRWDALYEGFRPCRRCRP